MLYEFEMGRNAVEATRNIYGNLLSFLLRCGTRPYERGTQWDINSNEILQEILLELQEFCWSGKISLKLWILRQYFKK